MRIALAVREVVVLAVVGDPADRRSLDGHRAERDDPVAHRPRRLERAVRQQAVVADGDPEAREHVADPEDHEIAPRHVAPPEQEDRGEEPGEGHGDGDDVRRFPPSAHFALFVHGSVVP
jgi:hypothetical protein